MGNYYEGTLTFFIRKDIDKEDFDDLKMMMDGFRQKESFSKKLQDSKWFQHEKWKSPCVDFYRLFRCNDDETSGYVWEDIEEVDMPEGFTFAGYVLKVSICTKLYRKDGNDLGLAIVDYLVPMCDITMYDDKIGTIGSICDEDCTYYKEFRLDEASFKKQEEERDFLCRGCRSRLEDTSCSHWEKCFRAYQIGRRNNKTPVLTETL